MPTDRFDHVFVQPASFDASLAFYRDTLGWAVEFAWGEAGEPRGASLSSGAMRIVLAEPHAAEDKSKTHGSNGTRPTLHLRVDDLDARHADLGARQRGAVRARADALGHALVRRPRPGRQPDRLRAGRRGLSRARETPQPTTTSLI